MSAAIKQALENLDQSISRMESGLSRRPARAGRGGQQDLFSAPASAAPASNVIGFDRNALARKLDMTIARVEQLLKEA